MFFISGSSDDVDRWSHDRYNPGTSTSRSSPSYTDGQTRPGNMATTRLPCQQSCDRSSPIGRQIKSEDHRMPGAGVDDLSPRIRKSDR